jgi:hypothetical protein
VADQGSLAGRGRSRILGKRAEGKEGKERAIEDTTFLYPAKGQSACTRNLPDTGVAVSYTGLPFSRLFFLFNLILFFNNFNIKINYIFFKLKIYFIL